MSVDRPTFTEGQVLGAADLEQIVTYDRFARVLHERTEHLWGVAEGLTLQSIDRTDANGNKYVDVNLLPGRAVDRLGRSIVVDTPRPLEVGDFTVTGTVATDVLPVFVQAIETPVSGTTQPGACAVQATTRIAEGLQVTFGSPGSELQVLQQDAVTVDAGFGTPPGLDDKVLVGWVRWDANIGNGNFVGVETAGNDFAIRYVGVIASEVVAGGGTLGLRTRPSGSRYAITVTETTTGGCELRFGKQDGLGDVSPTFTVDDKGNVAYTGTLSPAPVAKTMAQSGVVFDGMRLPLPAGVTEDQVTSGQVRVHVVLTPIVQLAKMIGPDVAIPLVTNCAIDANRRVQSTFRWQTLTTTLAHNDVPCACNYLLVASGG